MTDIKDADDLMEETLNKIITLIKTKQLKITGAHMNYLLDLLHNSIEEGPNIKTKKIKTQLELPLYQWCKYQKYTQRQEPKIDMGRCEFCAKPLFYTLYDDTLQPNHETCIDSHEIEVTINVPSGKLIANDMLWKGDDVFVEHLKLYPDSKNKEPDIGYTIGVLNTIRKFAEHNAIHIFVGNSCPSIFKHTDKDKYTIANYMYNENEETDETEGSYIPPVPVNSEHDIYGSICTDLWWVTIMDIELYKELLKNTLGETYKDTDMDQVLEKADAIINVKPGIYKLKYNQRYKNEDEMYGSFEYVGPITTNGDVNP